jgi:hypothetical protein
LALIAVCQLKESRGERKLAEQSLAIAQSMLRTQQRPELVAYQLSGGAEREVHIATYGSIPNGTASTGPAGRRLNARILSGSGARGKLLLEKLLD